MIKSILLTILFLIPTLVKADQVEVVTFEYRPYIQSEGDGLGLEVLIQALDSMGHTVKVKIYPRKRAINVFKKGDGDLFLGPQYYFPAESTRGHTIVYFRRVLVHKDKHNPVVSVFSLEGMAGKHVAMRLGSSQRGDFEQAGMVISATQGVANSLGMLDLNRVDFVYALHLEALFGLKELFPDRVDDFQFIEFGRSPGHVVERTDEADRGYLSDFQAGLKKIVEQGVYQRILETYYGKGKIPGSALVAEAK